MVRRDETGEAVPDFDRRWWAYVRIEIYIRSLSGRKPIGIKWLPGRCDGGNYFACDGDSASRRLRIGRALKRDTQLEVQKYARRCCGGERRAHDPIGSSTPEGRPPPYPYSVNFSVRISASLCRVSV